MGTGACGANSSRVATTWPSLARTAAPLPDRKPFQHALGKRRVDMQAAVGEARTSIISWSGADLACSVTVERHESRLDGSPEPVVFLYRATHVFRRENADWKIVLRHADPLARFVGPQVSHGLARL